MFFSLIVSGSNFFVLLFNRNRIRFFLFFVQSEPDPIFLFFSSMGSESNFCVLSLIGSETNFFILLFNRNRTRFFCSSLVNPDPQPCLCTYSKKTVHLKLWFSLIHVTSTHGSIITLFLFIHCARVKWNRELYLIKAFVYIWTKIDRKKFPKPLMRNHVIRLPCIDPILS